MRRLVSVPTDDLSFTMLLFCLPRMFEVNFFEWKEGERGEKERPADICKVG